MSILRWFVAGAMVMSLAACSGQAPRPAFRSASPVPSKPVVSSKPPVVKHNGWSTADLPVFPPAPPPEKVPLKAKGDGVPYVHRIETTQKVAFITIDDGYEKHPEAAELFRAAGVPVTLFLTTSAISDDPGYFKPLIDAGAVVEAHTITHPMLRGKSYAFQKRELCGSADKLATWYTRRPVLFRPPYGEKDSTTLKAAKDCGLKAGFFWTETVDKGKVRFQGPKVVQPGDIILMHFRPAFVKDFIAALKAIHKAGLTPALLEDYV